MKNNIKFTSSLHTKFAEYVNKRTHIPVSVGYSFLNKAAIKQTLTHLPYNSTVIISAKNTVYIDYDVLELIRDFSNYGSKEKNINVMLKDFKEVYQIENT